jgi:hypothetical protein
MEEGRNPPERLALPKSFAESDDPVEGNPYPTEHPAHRVWSEATRKAQAEICRINADASMTLTPDSAEVWAQTLLFAKFDVWARRGVQVVWTDQVEREYAAWLVEYANAWIESMSRFFTSHPPPFPPDMILADLRSRLGARVHHWRAEALQYRLQHEASAAAVAPAVQPPASAALIRRRRCVIKRHRDAQGLTALGFARSIGISEAGVNGIVREDRTRFNDVTQEKLLRAIRMTREEWYRE